MPWNDRKAVPHNPQDTQTSANDIAREYPPRTALYVWEMLALNWRVFLLPKDPHCPPKQDTTDDTRGNPSYQGWEGGEGQQNFGQKLRGSFYWLVFAKGCEF